MKLINCYIENFGKLHNFKYDFKDGLNIIKENNGFGKTTFATFIKSMFYGLDYKINVKAEKSERKRYTPWQGGNFGGNICFEIDGKKYRIERFFGKKPTEDTFVLYDLETNLESKDYTENIGEEIFKINKSGFERSTYIPQGQIEIEMEDSINAKLSNVLESDNDVNSSDEALKILNDSKKVYIKDRGNTGVINDKKDKLNFLERKLENSKSDEEVFETKKRKLEENIKEINELEAERENLQTKLSKKIEQGRKEAKKEVYQNILNRFNSAEENVNTLNKYFEENLPKEKDSKKHENILKICFAFSIVFLSLGIVLIAIQKLIPLSIIAIILSVIIFIYQQNEKAKLSNLKTKISMKKQEYETYLKEYKGIKEEKEKFEKENDIQELIAKDELSNVSETNIKAEITNINNRIDLLVDVKNQLKNQLDILENDINENEYLENDIENLKEEIEILNKKYKILSTAEELLKQAKDKFSSNYLKDMEESFDKYLKLINKEDLDTKIDTNLDVKIDVNGSQKEIKYFSTGYKDLIYICMRFSLINTLFKDEKPFAILDDPFTNLDEEKTKEALNILNEFAKKYQIIYFVCNSSRV